ncbi:MAG: pitrilysin family protein [Myxococcota bacterium]
MTRLLLILALACGGQTRIAEIPPIDEETDVERTEPEEIARPVRREDLGVLDVVMMPSSSPMVTLRVSFNAGSAEDPAGKEGITQLTATAMVEAGAGEQSYAQITEALYPMAGAMGAQTDRDQTVFVGRVHRDHLDAFYAIFRAVLAQPRFDASDVQRLTTRSQTALTLGLRGNDDEELGKETLQAMLYEGHPYGSPALGTERGLGGITREELAAHAAQVFCSGRATLGIAGGFDEAFATRVRSDLAELRRESCVGRIVLETPSLDGPRVWLVDKADSRSVAVSMGVPVTITRDHPDYPALMLAAAYLGQHRTFAGRLMQKMRGDRGLNYGDYAYMEHFAQEGWTRFPRPNTSRRQQYFSAWVRPVQPDQAHFAIRMAVRELRAFVETGLSDEDFTRIRTFVNRYYALYLQTESRRLGFALDDRFYDTPDPWIEGLQRAWEGLTAAEVNAAIRRHVDLTNLQIAIVTSDAASLADTLASEAESPFRHRGTPPAEVAAEDREIARYRIGIPRERMRIIPVDQLFRE